MKLLAIDTSTEACSAALHIDGEIYERYEIAPRRHAELILSMADQLLTQAGIKLNTLDALAFGRGPGSFTGVRIASGVIQGLSFASELPVVSVSSLAVMAQGAVGKSQTLFSAIDARMEEIYWCFYRVAEDQLVLPLNDEKVSSPDSIDFSGPEPCYGIGSGWGRYRDVLIQKFGKYLAGIDAECYPRARDMIPLAIRDFKQGNVVAAGDALPVYLRNEVTG